MLQSDKGLDRELRSVAGKYPKTITKNYQETKLDRNLYRYISQYAMQKLALDR